jgi:hypothetical protein
MDDKVRVIANKNMVRQDSQSGKVEKTIKYKIRGSDERVEVKKSLPSGVTRRQRDHQGYER